MGVRKIAISVPEDVLKQVDRLAKRVSTTRSGFITDVLREVSRASGRAEVTRRIDRLFDSDPSLAMEQRRTATEFLRAADPGDDESPW